MGLKKIVKKIMPPITFAIIFVSTYLAQSFEFIMFNGGLKQMELNIKIAVIDLNLIENPIALIILMIGIAIISFGLPMVMARVLTDILFKEELRN